MERDGYACKKKLDDGGMTIAVLMTCFNRVTTTLECLRNLFACDRPRECAMDIWLVDDASADRTGEHVQAEYPSVHVLYGDGNRYWCGGMRLAWETAASFKEYDAFLWLNDDTFLYPNALQVLVQAVKEAKKLSGDEGLIVGAVCDPATGKTTYGFSGNSSRVPDGTLSAIRNETINGNVVWVSRMTWQKVGGLRACFTHAMGDTDYGVRALRNKIPIRLTPSHVGTCSANKGKRWDDVQTPLLSRLKLLHSVKGCPPFEFMKMVQVAHPLSWPIYMVKLYWRVLFPGAS